MCICWLPRSARARVSCQRHFLRETRRVACSAKVFSSENTKFRLSAAGHIILKRLICMDRSYQAENARSRPLPEAKLPWASPVVGWVTTCEPDVTICSFALSDSVCFSFLSGLLCSQIRLRRASHYAREVEMHHMIMSRRSPVRILLQDHLFSGDSVGSFKWSEDIF